MGHAKHNAALHTQNHSVFLKGAISFRGIVRAHLHPPHEARPLRPLGRPAEGTRNANGHAAEAAGGHAAQERSLPWPCATGHAGGAPSNTQYGAWVMTGAG